MSAEPGDWFDRRPLPVFRKPRGGFAPIRGTAADSWPYSRTTEIDGALFVEMPLPSRDGWGMTFHRVRRYRTPLGRYLSHYHEGRSSGFPVWPTVVFAIRYCRGRG